MSKRNVLLIYVAIVLIVTACSSEAGSPDVLTQEQMVPVLADLEIAYAGVDYTVKDPRLRVKKYQEMNAIVLKKHGMDSEVFYSSYQWYESNPALLDTIFKQVVGQLNADLANLEQGVNAQPRGKVPELK
jgi:hypothetical protein